MISCPPGRKSPGGKGIPCGISSPPIFWNMAGKQVLGHADTAFLERTYCHPQDVCKEEAAVLFDSLLEPAGEDYYDALQD